ncbi:MAG: regulatory protein RecX [Candidatus Omnitrophica bacterium]|nr:recombination regulator RecX [Candidatus Omnitrophota bacterium]MDD5078871.1 regulatory protein RecX [Candidatus Omnitrophota bacterium]
MRNSRDPESQEQAREYAFFLLKFRLRTEKELYQRLKRKSFSEGCVNKTLEFLKAKRFIDDRLFAKAWVESRLKKPLGLRRLAAELKIKGVAEEIINSRLNEAKKGYSEEDVVKEIIRQKQEKTRGIDPLKAKKRIYSYLLRRGFSPEVVIDSISRLKI